MKAHLIYHGPINEPSARNVETLCIDALKNGAKEIVLCISSGGGNVNAGIGLYNFLLMLPVPIHTHNFGNCGSIAATIFMAGDKRTCSPISNFMLHAATYVEGPKCGQISENTDLISKPFEVRGKIPKKQLEAYFRSGEGGFITAEEALTLGIALATEDLQLPSDGNFKTVRIEA